MPIFRQSLGIADFTKQAPIGGCQSLAKEDKLSTEFEIAWFGGVLDRASRRDVWLVLSGFEVILGIVKIFFGRCR